MTASHDPQTRPLIDIRSDTVTKPTPAMRRAMADADVGDDVLDGDPTTRRLEAMVAERLGKEQALFFPTGTMANQVAIWLHTQPGTEVFVHAESHIVHWEMAGASALAGVQLHHVRGATSVMLAADLAAAFRPFSAQGMDASLVCYENTHNGAGGVVTSLDASRAIYNVARTAGLPVHLDGARLWNAAAATATSLANFASCADTVMVSFTKGLGAPVGAALVGSAEHIARAYKIRKRFGGGMRQSGVLAAAAIYGLEHHVSRLTEDHEAARCLANLVDGVGGAIVVHPDTNIVMLDLPTPCADAIVARARSLGVLVSAWTPSRIRVVTHLDAPISLIAQTAPLLVQAIAESLL